MSRILIYEKYVKKGKNMKFDKLKKVGIVIGLFVFIWAVLNLVPIGKFKISNPFPIERYCTLNYFYCYSDIGEVEGYPNFLGNPIIITLITIILPAILTFFVYKFIIENKLKSK
ncbi:hypothetical protein HYS31_00135 [Candidatus Woesearchaeota archaeon]|nr:hypothetical protein [Candidatus Woesearchaeota archaeon]